MSRKRNAEPGEGTETMEEMNARLVAHIRALQSELRKYMDFDKVRPSFRDQFATLAPW